MRVGTIARMLAATLLIALLGAAPASGPASAPASQPAGAGGAGPTKFYGIISAVDPKAQTFTVDNQTFSIVGETHMTKAADDSPATLADAIVGEPARGTYTKSSDGKLNVTKVRFGKKTGGGGKAAGKKKDPAPATQPQSQLPQSQQQPSSGSEASSLSLASADGAVALAKTSGAFHHPGILVNRAQLDFVKAKIAAGEEPWKSALAAAKASELGAIDYQPKPWKACECGPFSKPDLGCKDEQRDSAAAYTQALLWYLTGDKTYAHNAIKIMNAWSETLAGGHTNSNGPVQAAWCAEQFPRAAEIIRYTSDDWSSGDIDRFKEMLRRQYLPSLVNGSCENGNKELSMADAMINIGVFNDDREAFDRGIKMWRGRAPAYIYLTSDGPTPLKAAGCDDMPIWTNKGQSTPLVDGLLQESVRDSGHANMALASMVNAAETARQQGIDLYGEQAKRIVAALEFQAQFLPPNHAPPAANVIIHKHPTWEIAYNHFHNRMGFDLPKTAAVLPTLRPTGWNHQMAWETLTHAGVGNVGLPPLSEH